MSASSQAVRQVSHATLGTQTPFTNLAFCPDDLREQIPYIGGEEMPRTVRGRSRSDWDDNLLDAVSDPEAATPESDLMLQQILRAVNGLPEAQREVMLLVGVEQFSYKEAAEILDVPMGTVMSRLSRARQAIGALFNPAEGKSIPGDRQRSDGSR